MVPIILVFVILLCFKPNLSLNIYTAIPHPIGTGTNWDSEDIVSNIDKLDWWLLAPKNNFTESIAQQIKETFQVILLLITALT